MSRNVVREAIKSLEIMGIVRASPGRGTELQPFSLDYMLQMILFFQVPGNEKVVRQMFDVRKHLELSYMREAFDALTREDIAHLREIADQIRESYDREGVFADLDREFHLTLFRPLKQQVLYSGALRHLGGGRPVSAGGKAAPSAGQRHEARCHRPGPGGI